MTSIDVDHLRSWIGRQETAEDVIDERLVEGYRATLDPHLAPVAEGEAPLAIHWCLAPPTVPASGLGPDGHPARGGFLPPVPLPRRMWAGGTIETRGALRIGDRVTRRSIIQDVSLKEGRTGPLCFVAVRHVIETPRGVALVERHDIVYRDAPAPGAAPPAPGSGETPAADLTWSVPATSTLLFRYSALTFNGHRIHYDHPYATQVEGYAGLVVHGPLQAALLLNAAATLTGVPPRQFRYRGVSPLTAGGVFRVHAVREEGGAVRAWTDDGTGRVCMEAGASEQDDRQGA